MARDVPKIIVEEEDEDLGDKVFADRYDDVGPGWKPILQSLGEALTHRLAQKPDTSVQVLQVKEKFGSLRVYLSWKGLVSDEVWALVGLAERISGKVCEMCGKPGTSRTQLNARYGWLKTFCEEHHAERDAQYLPTKYPGGNKVEGGVVISEINEDGDEEEC